MSAPRYFWGVGMSFLWGAIAATDAAEGDWTWVAFAATAAVSFAFLDWRHSA